MNTLMDSPAVCESGSWHKHRDTKVAGKKPNLEGFVCPALSFEGRPENLCSAAAAAVVGGVTAAALGLPIA